MKIKYAIYICLMFLIGCEAIVNRMAFFPTVTKSVAVENIPAGVKEVYITTDDNVRLQCFLVSNNASKNIVVYFHGNAGNIYDRIPELIAMAKTGLNVLGIGYRGYGKSTGKPSEKGIYEDGAASLKYVMETLGYLPDKIFICGRSLGTVVALNISMKKKLAGIILITPLTSGKEMSNVHGFGPLSVFAGDAFNNLKKLPEIISPVLIIHGDKDEVVPWAMGKHIFESLQGSKKMVTIKNGFHNDLKFSNPELYWNSIAEFVQIYGNN
ncbi:MAG: alpha/beta hydrolase [Bacteroidetes bacterium]|nr:alpha/beta hydrolase [Bacteroidota bacterium]